MKSFLLPHLICPACLPREHRLELTADRERDGDVTAGHLSCRACRRRFPIRDGVALLLPNPDAGPSGGQWRYEEAGMVDRYLWSHYGELAGVPANGAANEAWAGQLAATGGAALDAGCAVGRMTFEMAARCAWAVGCDLSLNFIKAARRLARERELTFSLPLEGNLRETFRIRLPDQWRSDNLEFIVADALALPFAAGTFQQAASLNLLDRVAYPLAHLVELTRTATDRKASLLLASPFSWTTSAAPEEKWLGGTVDGRFPGSGAANVRALLEGKENLLAPPWNVARTGEITWKMRSHRHHHELITSQFLMAER
jgi:uncharacterized protein YbaR (Trm112 family)